MRRGATTFKFSSMQRESEPSETQLMLLEAYLKLCTQIGVTEITLQKVADKAEVAFRTVHYHFRGKNRDLPHSAVLYVGQRAQHYISTYLEEASLKSDYIGIYEYIKGTFQWACDLPSHASFWFYYFYLTSIQTHFRKENGQFLKKAQARIVLLLNESVGREIFPPLKEAEALALKLHALLMGGVLSGVIDPTKGALGRQRSLTLASAKSLIESHQKSKISKK